jgi:uncharacterized protein DUF5658
MTAVCALIFAASLSGDSGRLPVTEDPTIQVHARPIAAAVAATPPLEGLVEPWMFDRTPSRPRTLAMLYGSLGALQALDVYSTFRSLNAGATEINPVVRKASSPAAMIGIKAVSTAASIYFAERAWKSNRKAAVVLMAVVNGVTAAVAANNLRHSRGVR